MNLHDLRHIRRQTAAREEKSGQERRSGGRRGRQAGEKEVTVLHYMQPARDHHPALAHGRTERGVVSRATAQQRTRSEKKKTERKEEELETRQGKRAREEGRATA